MVFNEAIRCTLANRCKVQSAVILKPPYSNRGVTDTPYVQAQRFIYRITTVKTDRHIDWISVTLASSQNWRNFIPFADLRNQGQGRHGYRQRWVDANTGAVIETGADDERMGHHITMSGDVLVAMRQDLGAIDDAIIGRIQQWDGKCSRIDLAIDIYGARLNPGMLNEALLNGRAKTPARVWRYIAGHDFQYHGATVDTGSVKSDRRFRFYDKNAEQHIKDGEAWVRLELQLRRLYALATVEACHFSSCAKVIPAQFGFYLKWSDTEYQAAIAGDTPYISLSARKQSKRQKWLLSQVAVSLATECSETPGFMDKFLTAVGYFTEKINKR